MIWQFQPDGQLWTAPFRRVLGRRENVGPRQGIFDRLDIRMGVGDVLRNPPTFDAAVGQRLGGDNQTSLGYRFIERYAKRIDP